MKRRPERIKKDLTKSGYSYKFKSSRLKATESKSEKSQTKLKLGTKEHNDIRIEHTKDELEWNYQLKYF